MEQGRLHKATEILKEGAHCCVVLRGDELFTSGDFGIKPLMTFLREDKQFFKSAVVADKIIGKAAALLLIYGGAEQVHGELMSDSAAEILEKSGMDFTWSKRVPNIENRTRTGLCPMEETVLSIESPAQAFEALEATIAKLMANKA